MITHFVANPSTENVRLLTQPDGRNRELRSSEIAVGVIIGRMSEFFDFFVYAIAAVLVFPKLVFPFSDPFTATAYSFAIFSLAFVARPLGTIIFTMVDQAYGRGVKLTIALLLLGTSTVAVAFLPGYDEVGLASAFWLGLLRIGQGLSVAGAWDGLASLLAVSVPPHRRGWYAMIPQLGATLGLILASGLFVFFASALSAEDFLDWGWRYPFLVAFAINVVALFARLRLAMSPEFAQFFEARQLEPTSAWETMRTQGGKIIVGTFAPLASFALLHMVTVFPLAWVFLYTTESPAHFLMIEIIGACIGLLTVVLSGPIADRVGRIRLLIVCAILIGMFSCLAPELLNGGDTGETIFMVLGFVLLGLSFGQSSGSVASHFPKSYRYTGSALTTDFAWLVGAGFAPLVALMLSNYFGLIAAGAYLLSAAICTTVALLVNVRLERKPFANRLCDNLTPKSGSPRATNALTDRDFPG
jgi:MFS family permease